MRGNELAVVQKKLLSIGPTYEIYHGGQLKAVVKESLFTLFGHRFTIDDEHGAGNLEARGTSPITSTHSRETAGSGASFGKLVQHHRYLRR